jgi:FkbM family methyltransferase
MNAGGLIGRWQRRVIEELATRPALGPLRSLWRRLRPTALALARRLQIRRERVLTTTYEGYVIHYPSLSIIGQAISTGRSWQGSLYAVVSALFDDAHAPTIVEVGSNIGSSLIEIKRARPDAKVYCFEPSDRFAAVLERNIADNRLEDIVVERLLVGADDGSAELFVNTSTASVATANYGGHDLLSREAIRMVALDSYLDSQAGVDLLKIDTDGFDHAVVMGAQQLARTHGPAIYCEFAPFLIEKTGGSGREFLALLQSLGYNTIFPILSGGQVLAAPLGHDDLLEAAEREQYIDLVAVHDLHPQQSEALRAVVAAGVR